MFWYQEDLACLGEGSGHLLNAVVNSFLVMQRLAAGWNQMAYGFVIVSVPRVL